MSTDPNPYAPPQADVADPPRANRQGKSLLPLWLIAAYCILGSAVQLLASALLLARAWPLPSIPFLFYLRLMSIFLMIAAGIALIRRNGSGAELLLTVLILGTEFRVMLPFAAPGQSVLPGPMEIPDFAILAAITWYAYVLRGREVLGPAPGAARVEGVGSSLPAAAIYCLIPGVLYLLTIALPQISAVSEGVVSPPSYLLGLVVAVLGVVAGIQLYRGSSQSPQLLLVLSLLSLLRAAVPAFWPTYLPLPGVFLMLNFAVLVVITAHVFALRRRGVLMA
jgi:hypothetical protein